MIQKELIPEIMKAAQAKSIVEAALYYARMGFSVLPLSGKRPACGDWKQYQQEAASHQLISKWNYSGILQNVGLVCGAVSGNLVVLDLDGAAGYPAFAATFPALADTYTVISGGGIGRHVYWRVDNLPEAVKAMGTPIGNLEICAEGRQVVAPPSIHPDTQQPYRVEKALDILHMPDLTELVAWVESFKAKPAASSAFRAPRELSTNDSKLNPRVLSELETYFLRRGYREMGDWLHGACIYPGRHKHGDRNPSFGFNRVSGYGYCYVCGTMLTKDICSTVGVDTLAMGGLVEKPQAAAHLDGINLSDAPADELPPEPPDAHMNIADLKLPGWLQRYVDWAGATGNQTPLSFHLAAGLWLLATAVGRRLYAEAPWGISIFPNLYLMLIADTTYYRKSTAYKLAEQIAREAIPHMLMPTPGSPERFQEALAGRMPANFEKLTKAQQERLKKAQPFAAQRGLLKDEVAGLFGAINRKEYMVGMKDLLMELYDCPDYSDKDTQSGLTVVENAALSILGVTTPAGLSMAVSDADWANGLLIRFALLTPETDYQERPAQKKFQSPPPELIVDLRRLHDRLPQPQMTEMGLSAPGSLKLQVECWEACQEYSQTLRNLCNPNKEVELDERMKGVYGRMHVQAFKLATLLASLDWLDSDTPVPVVTDAHWRSAKAIAEMWRESAARLLTQLDRSGEAVQERREQDRLLQAIRRGGSRGCNLRDLYRNLNLSAKRARQLAQDLVKAGLVVERLMDRAEWYIATEFVRDTVS